MDRHVERPLLNVQLGVRRGSLSVFFLFYCERWSVVYVAMLTVLADTDRG